METDQKEVKLLVDRLFRHEYGRLVSVLTGIFGSEHLELAEDVVQESLVKAIKNWTYNGIPDNPKGWLYSVARNRAINILNKKQFKFQHTSEIARFLQSEWTLRPTVERHFSEKEIRDDQLRMIFTCCHPSITRDSQVALALKTLCGFNISEIARAFLTNKETINKRLVRARRTIRNDKIPFDIPAGSELTSRLQAVLETLYLLFNEGYKASEGDQLIRNDLVDEAMRLTEMIVSHPSINEKKNGYALLALMQLNASRFKARQDENGQIVTLEHQDRSQWDRTLIDKGFLNLQKSEPHQYVTRYHILAVISAYHCAASTYGETNWNGILQEYDKLTQIDHSPVVMLNRAVALSKVEGANNAIDALDKIHELKDYHLFYNVKAEFQIELDQYDDAIETLNKAYKLATVEKEKEFIKKRMAYCRKKEI